MPIGLTNCTGGLFHFHVLDKSICHFQLAWTKSRKSYCTTRGVAVGVGFGIIGGGGVSRMLKFYVKVFYVMGKALSGELSCPCDRSCWGD